jgi:hypothetical protein
MQILNTGTIGAFSNPTFDTSEIRTMLSSDLRDHSVPNSIIISLLDALDVKK